MSKETLSHLNTKVLIGNTDHRGHAWHFKADEQGAEPNHYAGAIPVADVQRRLFHWQAESRRMAMEIPADVETMTHLTEDGTPARWAVQADLQGIARNDSYHRMGQFTPGYEMHQYSRLATKRGTGSSSWVPNGVASVCSVPPGWPGRSITTRTLANC